MSLSERFKHTPWPLTQLSIDIAREIYETKDEIDRLACEQGSLHQSGKAEAYEWTRLCALLIEDVLEKRDAETTARKCQGLLTN